MLAFLTSRHFTCLISYLTFESWQLMYIRIYFVFSHTQYYFNLNISGENKLTKGKTNKEHYISINKIEYLDKYMMCSQTNMQDYRLKYLDVHTHICK